MGKCRGWHAVERRLACSKFLVPYTNDLKQEYRDFRDVKGAASGKKFNRLIAIHTLLALLNVNVDLAK